MKAAIGVMRKKGRGGTLCWFCKRCYGQCEWSKDFKAVPGWSANVKYKKDGTIRRAWVGWCPKFLADDGFIEMMMHDKGRAVQYVASETRYTAIRYHIINNYRRNRNE